MILKNRRLLYQKLNLGAEALGHALCIEQIDNFLGSSNRMQAVNNSVYIYFSNETGLQVGREVIGNDSNVSGKDNIFIQDYNEQEVTDSLKIGTNIKESLNDLVAKKTSFRLEIRPNSVDGATILVFGVASIKCALI